MRSHRTHRPGRSQPAAASPHSHYLRTLSRLRRASFIAPHRHRIDERLIVGLACTLGHGQRLPVRRRAERARIDIRHPDLDRAQALLAQTFAVALDLHADGLQMRYGHVDTPGYMKPSVSYM